LYSLGISAEVDFNDFAVVEQYGRAGGFLRELNPMNWSLGHNFPVLYYLKLRSVVVNLQLIISGLQLRTGDGSRAV